AGVGRRSTGSARPSAGHGPSDACLHGTTPKSRARPDPRLQCRRMAGTVIRVTPAAVPGRKPAAVARRVSLFEREVRMHLGTAAIEVLFAVAEVLSEGGRDGARYFGSTMITIDLGRARGLV